MRRARAGAVLLAVLLAAACTNGSTGAEPSPEPDVSVTDTATETGSPTPDSPPTPPPLPEAATQPTKAGAVAFARHYWGIFNYSLARMDPEPLAALNRNGCATCEVGPKLIRELRRHGAAVRGGAFSVLRASATRDMTEAADKRLIVTMDMSSESQTIDRPGPEDDEEFEGGASTAALFVDWFDGRWQLSFVDVN